MARPAASRAAWVLATAACLARASAQTTFNTANQLKNYAEGCAAPCEEASGWDISELTSLNSAFKWNAGFNGNISGWDVSNVQDMADMFFQAAAFDHDITGWDDSSVTSSRKMFDGATAWHVRFVRTDGGDAIDGPPSAFASRNCDPTAYAASGECECAANHRVASGACVACDAGYVNAAGDDITGADTTCGECAEDYYVSSNACVACATDTINDAGDDTTGADTTCTLRYCAENERVSGGVCAPCASGYFNAAGDDRRGGSDTECGECAEDYYVSSNACAACAAGSSAPATTPPARTPRAPFGTALRTSTCRPVCARRAGYVNAAGDDTRGGVDTACEPRPRPSSFVFVARAFRAFRARARPVAPPYLQRLFPDKGHVVGGTTVTIFGGGFVRGPHVTVRFSHASGEVDVVPASVIDSVASRASPQSAARAPRRARLRLQRRGVHGFLGGVRRGHVLALHVRRRRAEGALDAGPLGGPRGRGHGGGDSQPRRGDAARLASDAAFLPGRHLRCRFGEHAQRHRRDDVQRHRRAQTNQHPWFGVGDAGSRSRIGAGAGGIPRARRSRSCGAARTDSSWTRRRGVPVLFHDGGAERVARVRVPRPVRVGRPQEPRGLGRDRVRVALDAPDRLYYTSGQRPTWAGL